jgi:hypothetical protein
MRWDGFAAQTFLGNDISTAAKALAGSPMDLVQGIISNPWSVDGAPINATAVAFAKAPIGPRARAVIGHNGYVEKFARIPLSETRTAQKVLGGSFGKMLGAASGVKFIYDAGTFLGAAIACSM